MFSTRQDKKEPSKQTFWQFSTFGAEISLPFLPFLLFESRIAAESFIPPPPREIRDRSDFGSDVNI